MSPTIMHYCLTGKHIDTAVLTMRKPDGIPAGGKPLDFFHLTMHDVIITSVQPASAAGKYFETVSLSFSKVGQ